MGQEQNFAMSNGGNPTARRRGLWLTLLALFVAIAALLFALKVLPTSESPSQRTGALKLDGSKLSIDGLSNELDLAPLIKDIVKQTLAEEAKEPDTPSVPGEPTTATPQTITNVYNSYSTQGSASSDSQTLSLSGSVLAISGGNSVNLPAETDATVGNEVTDVVASAGLLRVGAGTTVDPYKLGLISCANGEILKSSGSGVWACGTDGGGASYTADGLGLELVGTQFSLELNGTTLAKSASGLGINLSNANTWAALQTMGAGLEVVGNSNITGSYSIGGVTICSSTGCTASSTSAVLNGTSQQTANFNIVSAATGSIGAIIQGASGQTADLLRLNDGAGANQLRVTAAGKLLLHLQPTTTGSDGAIEIGAPGAQSSNDVNGVIGFLGSGVKHAQIAYIVGDGFYLCDSSAGSPSGDFGQCATRVNLHGANADFNGTALFQNTANSTSAFRVLNDGGVAVLRVDTTNQRVAIGNVAPVQKFEVQDGDAAVYNSGNNTRFIIGDDSTSGQYGYLQWDSTNDYLRFEKNGSNGLKLNDNFLTIGNIFPDQPLKVANGVTLLAQVSTTGQALFQNSSDSSTAFQILNGTGVPAFVVDTTTNAVKIGGGDVSASATPGLLILDHKSTAGDPTGTDGGMYYNASAGKMRCYEAGVWKNCLGMSQNITFNATSGAGSTSDWDDVTAGAVEMFFANPLVANAASRVKYDLTEATQARLQFNVELVSGAATNTEARVQYSTDQSSWNNLDGASGPAVNITTTGLKVSSWVDIAAGAKDDVFLRVIGINGDGTTDYDVGVVSLQVR